MIQRPDRFTFYASIDHLHADGQFVGMGLIEFQTMYAELIAGNPPVELPLPATTPTTACGSASTPRR